MELLSPAGDFEGLKTAVYCGADAIYVGGKSFSARKNAKNFTDDELILAIDFCHLRGIKLFVTLNTLIKEDEFSSAVSFAKFLIENGADGIIIQDLGLLLAVRKMSDDIKINASTQMTVCSTSGVNLLSELGANRVVLARELTYEDIKSIKENTTAELEMFVHGALCMGWSGQCLLSSIIGGRSGNRGLCAQPCRLNYTLYKDGKKLTEQKPLLCTKDLCLADKMDEIKKICDSFKIEGRMKSAEYTGIVTKAYKKALLGELSEKEINEMLSFFSRGGSGRGYFDGRTFSKMMDYGESGKISASKEMVRDVKEEKYEKLRKISFKLIAKEGEPLELFGKSDGFSHTETGDVCEKAKQSAPDKERIEAQLKKLGDTPFSIDNIEIEISGTPFVSVSSINALRRAVCENISQKICASYKRSAVTLSDDDIPTKVTKPDMPKVIVYVRTKEQLDAANDLGIKAKYLSYDLFLKYGTEKDVCVLPVITKENEKLDLSKAKYVMVQNIGQIKDAEGKILCAGEHLNATNTKTLSALSSLGLKRVTLSGELNLKEIRKITKKTNVSTELIVYGRQTAMVMENCVIKSAYKCAKGESGFSLCDRMGEHFPVICENCRNLLLNSVPLYMADKCEDFLSVKPDAVRLNFTTESYDECKNIILAYKSGLSGKPPKKVFDKITRGHFYRGVE
ncbi:MAG: U32 family peptidase [Clostridia bacterium]|nr:U32 family peptidase [Clostridia bacterium]